MGSTLGRLHAQCRVMRSVVRNWPTLTQCLAGMALWAGCHGMEPLQVDVQDPLKRNERDVVFAGSGSGCSPETCTGTAGRVAPSTAGRGSQSSGIDATPDAGSRSRGSTGAAGRTGTRGSGRAAAGQDGGAAGASSGSAGRPPTAPTRPTRPTRPTSSVAGSSGSPAAGTTGGDNSVCGNDIIEATESCEQTDLNGFSCASFGYPAGVLLCDPFTCLFDLSQCRRQPQGGAAGSGTEPIDAGVGSVGSDGGAPSDAGATADASVADAAVPDEDAGELQGL